MKKIINLHEVLLNEANDNWNPALTNWAKYVEDVNTEENTGWMYIGDFVRSGSVEVEIKPTVFIVLSTSGTAADPLPIYRVVLMDHEGNIYRTDIFTDGLSRGWALRLRDDVIDVLMHLEIETFTSRMKINNVLPVDTVEMLKQDAMEALAAGLDVEIYPELLLTLIQHYEERMNL